LDLLDAASYHQLALNSAGRSPRTLQLYLLYQKRFLEYLEARNIPPALDALNAVNVRQAVLWFQQRQVGPRRGEVATGMFLNVLKTWAGFLEQEGVWETSPLRRVRRMKVRKLERQPYTRAEVNAILHACDTSRQPDRDRLLVLLLLDTGGRISEITGLRLGDVRTDLRSVRVLGKGNRERTIPVGVPTQPDGGPLFRALRQWLRTRDTLTARHPDRSGDRLLLTFLGYPLVSEGATEVIRRLGDAAGVDGAIPHRFRHTYATLYLTKYPGDETGLRRIMGHLSRDVMSDYAHIAQNSIAQRAGRVSPAAMWLTEREGTAG
jgi:site-specific recombinase XerD